MPFAPIWCINSFRCYFVSHMSIHYFLFMHLVPSRFMLIILLSFSWQWCSIFVIWCYLSNLQVDFLPQVNDICGIYKSHSFNTNKLFEFKSLKRPLKGKEKYFESNWYLFVYEFILWITYVCTCDIIYFSLIWTHKAD